MCAVLSSWQVCGFWLCGVLGTFWVVATRLAANPVHSSNVRTRDLHRREGKKKPFCLQLYEVRRYDGIWFWLPSIDGMLPISLSH